MIKEWNESVDATFAEAVQAIREDVANGTSLDGSISHYADLFQINENALRHEWDLRNN